MIRFPGSVRPSPRPFPNNNAGFGLAALGRELEGIEVLKRVLPWTVLEYGDSSPHADLVRNNIRFAESRLAARASAE